MPSFDMSMRFRAGLVVCIAGLVCVVLASGAFNAAGLVWAGGGIKQAGYWESPESYFAVAVGALLVVAWLFSILFTGVIMIAGSSARSTRGLGIVLACASLVLGSCLLVVFVALLPSQSTWGA